MRLFLFILCIFSNCYAQVSQSYTMQDVMSYFQNSDKETLGVFDIDMVLVQPKDPAFQMANIKRHSLIAKKITASLPKEKHELFLTLMTTDSPPILIDENTPYYLQELCKKGIPTIALTANLTGPFATITNLESWKVEALRKLGIDFTCNAPYPTPIVFLQLPTYRGNYPVFTKGILFTNGPNPSKGEVLVHFLKAAKYSPKKIIFVDDKEENLKNVEEALTKYNPSISYKGVQYLGAKQYPSPLIGEREFEMAWEKLATSAKESK